MNTNNNTNNTNQYIPLLTQTVFNTASQEDTNIQDTKKEQHTYDDYQWYSVDGEF